jgi:GT2 family glycosyltransferase
MSEQTEQGKEKGRANGHANGQPNSGNPKTPRKPSKPVEIPLESRRANAVTDDETYGALRADNRVVMRHNIALNLDVFAAATEEFIPRPQKEYPALRPVTAPFFSVIVPNHNGQAHLPTLFNALVGQAFKDFEIIFVDDASQDDSVALVEEGFGEKLSLRVVANRQNLGFAASVNLAAQAARGRVLVLLNNDTEPEAAWLTELARAICANPDAAIVASKLLLFDRRNTLHTTGDLLGADGVPRNRGVWEEDTGQYDERADVFSGCGGAMAVRRDVWQALGGFDEDFWMYLEDVDLAFRAQLSGWRVVFAPQARVYHKLSSSGGDELASYYVGRNTLWLLAKNLPTGLFLKRLGQILAGQLRIAGDALNSLPGEAAQRRLLGQLAGIAGLPAILHKRRLIQARRWRSDEEMESQLNLS